MNLVKNDILKSQKEFMVNWIKTSSSKFLAGNNYTIADIATWPWLQDMNGMILGLKNYKNLTRWYKILQAEMLLLKDMIF